MKLYTGSNQPERQAGTCTAFPHEAMACAIPADPSVPHASALMNLGSPCFHFHILSLADCFSASVLHTEDATAVCRDNARQMRKQLGLLKCGCGLPRCAAKPILLKASHGLNEQNSPFSTRKAHEHKGLFPPHVCVKCRKLGFPPDTSRAPVTATKPVSR